MKTIKRKALILVAALILGSCAHKVAPPSIVIPRISPQVEAVSHQANKTTVQADETVILSQKVAEKYKNDETVISLGKSAILTAKQSRETEFQLAFLQEYADGLDLKAGELMESSAKKDAAIAKKDREVGDLKVTAKELKAKVASRNGYLFGAGAFILILLALVLKPWRWA